MKFTRILSNQNTHLHPIACARNPPHTGPITGPTIGPIVQIEIAAPRSSALNRSPKVPPPIVTAVELPAPAKNRNTISIFRLLLAAHAIVRTTKRKFETWYTGTRPYNSESGAAISGPTEYPNTYMERTSAARKELVEWNSWKTSSTSGANMNEASGLFRVSNRSTRDKQDLRDQSHCR